MAEIQGFCDPTFARVREQFARNFDERGDVGASVCITVGGRAVVDLWGGLACADPLAPWTRDTVALIWSTTKGATSLCAYILATRGLLDLDAPIAQYWPQFGARGKERITVRMALNHQAGLPALREPVPPGAIFDWDYMVKRMEQEELFWEPGTRHGYHAATFGWIVGELVRRVTGRSLGLFFRDEVARPLGLDFWIGLPEPLEPRVAQLIAPTPPAPARRAERASPTLGEMATANIQEFISLCNSRAAHAPEFPAGNGITHARALAGMYAPLACGGSLRGVSLVDADSLARMAAVSSAGWDAVQRYPTRYTDGFCKSWDNRRQYPSGQTLIMSEDAFGYPGAGGSVGLADPRHRLSFGYVMNKMGGYERAQALIDATYLSLGCRSKASGGWI